MRKNRSTSPVYINMHKKLTPYWSMQWAAIMQIALPNADWQGIVPDFQGNFIS